VTADVQPTFETCAEVGADALLQAPGPSQEQLLNVVPSQFGSTLATADLQPVAVSAARSMNMMPSADSREQHFELVDGLDSLHSYTASQLHSYTALAAEAFLQVPAASLPPIVATAASQLFVPAAPSATLQLYVVSDDSKYALFTAASPARLVSSSAAVALQSVGRFQLTATGKQLVDSVQPLMCVQHVPALCGKHSAALRFLLFAQLQCSCRVQPFDTAASSVLVGHGNCSAYV